MTDDFFATLLEKIQQHPTYDEALRSAIAQGRTLVLNYHSHGDPGQWCISISALQRDPEKLLQIGLPELDELVHVKGIGSSEEQCLPFCHAFAERLRDGYGLKELPMPMLNGRPVEDPAQG